MCQCRTVERRTPIEDRDSHKCDKCGKMMDHEPDDPDTGVSECVWYCAACDDAADNE
jgi:hypothetical protein